MYSGPLKLGTQEAGGFVSDEKATNVDLNMVTSLLDVTGVPWFDPEGIADAVHRYQNGETEISYVDAGEMVSGLLMGIFEQMAGLSEEGMEGSTEAGAEIAAEEEPAAGDATN